MQNLSRRAFLSQGAACVFGSSVALHSRELGGYRQLHSIDLTIHGSRGEHVSIQNDDEGALCMIGDDQYTFHSAMFNDTYYYHNTSIICGQTSIRELIDCIRVLPSGDIDVHCNLFKSLRIPLSSQERIVQHLQNGRSAGENMVTIPEVECGFRLCTLSWTTTKTCHLVFSVDNEN